jgi:hypothetical protein
MIGGILVCEYSSYNKVYNNTIYSCRYGLIIDQYTGSSCLEQGTNNEAKNNITYNSTVAEIHTCAGKSNVLSNNLHYKSVGMVLLEDNVSKTTAYWTANWDANAIYTDPLFTNIGSLPSGLILQPGSLALNTGLDLGAPYNIDYNGDTRPKGSDWDRGSYECDEGRGGDPYHIMAPIISIPHR